MGGLWGLMRENVGRGASSVLHFEQTTLFFTACVMGKDLAVAEVDTSENVIVSSNCSCFKVHYREYFESRTSEEQRWGPWWKFVSRKAVRSAFKDFKREGTHEVRQVRITLRTRMQEHHEVGLSRSATKNSGGVNINTPMIFLFVVSVRHVNWIASSVVFF